MTFTPERPAERPKWVVKLGGSLATSPHLPHWLNALADTGSVIVPGGGPFADAVRTAQAHWRFDEATAHHMAILAMRQYGLMLCGLCPQLAAASAIGELQRGGRAKVWLPSPEQLDAAGIPATWDITSDSLAAWLAGQTGAAHLLLVKAAEPSEASGPWVDPAFPRYALSPLQSWLCGPDQHTHLAAIFSGDHRRLTRLQNATL